MQTVVTINNPKGHLLVQSIAHHDSVYFVPRVGDNIKHSTGYFKVESVEIEYHQHSVQITVGTVFLGPR